MAFEFLRKVSQFIKIEHTVFDLPFIFSGAVIASRGAFLPVTFLLILIAAVSARAAGMSINRIEGRTWDKINPRKKDWVLVNGKLSLKAAILLTVVFSAIFELVSYSLNYLVFLLSPIVLRSTISGNCICISGRNILSTSIRADLLTFSLRVRRRWM